MKRLFFEDSTIPDVQRQIAGVGSSAVDAGGMRLDSLLQNKNDDMKPQQGNKLYPISNIDEAISDAFINISNAQKLIDVANQNPTLKSSKKLLIKLENNLKDIAHLLVDFDETLSIIKGDER
jgi:hypothetical protein